MNIEEHEPHHPKVDPTLDQVLRVAIRNRTNTISFPRYTKFLNRAVRWDKERPILLPLAEVFGLTLENVEEVYFKGMTGRQLIEAICR